MKFGHFESDFKQILALMEEEVCAIKSEEILMMYREILPGKMLRSVLALTIFHCISIKNFPKNPPENKEFLQKKRQILKFCAIIELIQMASLLHDDVIDAAILRRGKNSINVTFGNKNAIMLGDALYSRAFFAMLDFPRDVAKIISNSVVILSRGEVKDVFFAQNFNNNNNHYENYIYMVADKTAALISCACEGAAMLCAHADPKQLAIFGQKLGICFQIIDDLLDVIGDEKSLKKPVFTDFAEGKITLPYILLLQKLPENDAKILWNFFKKTGDREWILAKMTEHGVIKNVQKIAKKYADDAVCALDPEIFTPLFDLARTVVEKGK